MYDPNDASMTTPKDADQTRRQAEKRQWAQNIMDVIRLTPFGHPHADQITPSHRVSPTAPPRTNA